jgi:hypothetical protein
MAPDHTVWGMTDLRDSPERHQPTNRHAHRHDDTPRPIRVTDEMG